MAPVTQEEILRRLLREGVWVIEQCRNAKGGLCEAVDKEWLKRVKKQAYEDQ